MLSGGARRRQIAYAVAKVAEALEKRQLLSLTPDQQFINTWEHLSAAAKNDIAVLEYQTPQYQSELDAVLEPLGLTPIAPHDGTLSVSEPGKGKLAHHHHPKPPHRPKPHHHLGKGGPTAPTVTSEAYLNDQLLPQGSTYAYGDELTYSFSEDVTSSDWTGAVSVIDLNTGTTIPVSATHMPAYNELVFELNDGSELSDGNYAAILHGSQLQGATSSLSVAGDDGISGDDSTFNFFFSRTDFNANFEDTSSSATRGTNTTDLQALLYNFNTAGTFSQGDSNYDGQINTIDLQAVLFYFNTSLPLLGTPGTPTLQETGGSRFVIAWNASSDPNVTEYDLYRDSTLIASDTTATTYMDSSLSAGTTHAYFVVGKDANNDSSWQSPELLASLPGAGSITLTPPAMEAISAGQTATLSVPFTDSGPLTTHTGSINWGDGTTATATVAESNNTGTLSGSHEFDSFGAYFGSISITDPGGSSATELFEIVVPTFYNTGPDGFVPGQAYALTPTFSDPDGSTPISYYVNWGDGSAVQTYGGSATDFTYVYPSASGSPFYCTVLVTAADGTFTDTPVIAEVAPTLSISGPSSITEGSVYTLSDSVSGPSAGDTYDFSIDWGDGSAGEDPTAPPGGTFTYVYDEAGTYTIDVVLTDDTSGEGDEQELTVAVQQATPTYSVMAPSGVTEGIAADFTDTWSHPAGHTLDNLTVDWGDGQTDAYYGDPHTETHTWETAGNYNVTETFSDDEGDYTFVDAVTVAVNTPTISIPNPTGVSEGQTFFLNVGYTDPATGEDPATYVVTWGDGQSDTYTTNPDYGNDFPHMYTTHGLHSLTLAITTDEGNQFTATSNVSVQQTGVFFSPQFLGFALDGSEYTLFSGFVGPAGQSPTYIVNWGDGQPTYSGANPNPTHAYAYVPDNTLNNDVDSFTLTVSEDDGTWTSYGQVDVHPTGGEGTLSMTGDSTATIGQWCTVTGTFNDNDQPFPQFDPPGATEFAISWGDGNIQYPFLPGNPPFATGSVSDSHEYTLPGNYTVAMYAIYDDSSSPPVYPTWIALATHTIAVGDITPSLSISGDTTAAVTGYTYTLSRTFKDPGNNHTPSEWTISWGDGTSTVYSGNPSTFTHVYTTASTTGTTYTIGATATTSGGSSTYTATASVVIAQSMMHALEWSGAEMDHNAQHSSGAYVAEDTSPTHALTSDPALLEVTFDLLPASVGGNYVLAWDTGDIRVWYDPFKQNQITSGYSFAAGNGPLAPVYVEGIHKSLSDKVDQLTLSWRSSDGSRNVSKVDYANMTVIEFSGPQDVPALGSYTYGVAGAIPANDQSADWGVSGGAITAKNGGSKAPTRAQIDWNGSPPNSGWVGTAYYDIDNFELPYPVNVVGFAINSSGGNSFATGTPSVIDGTQHFATDIDVKQVASSTGSGKGLVWNAAVTLNGPNGNAGVTKMRVGFVQNIVQVTNDGIYSDGTTLHSTLDSLISPTKPILDVFQGQFVPGTPWYSNLSNALWTPSSPSSAATTLTSFDSPHTGVPTVHGSADLQQINLVFLFNLYVCIQTLDSDNNAMSVYVPVANAAWSFNGDAVIDKLGKWNIRDDAKDSAPAGWGGSGGSPVTSGGLFNFALNNSQRWR
jgi:hypothetical protein